MAKSLKKRKKKASPAASQMASEAAGIGSDMVPGLAMTGQEETNWCWAAVTQTCVQALRSRSTSQEAVVTSHLHNTGRAYACVGPLRQREDHGSCNDVGCTSSCNDMHSISPGLVGEGLHVELLSDGDVPRFDKVQQAVRDRHPIACQVVWSGSGSHIILICGWSESAGDRRVLVLDPGDAAAGLPIQPRSVSYSLLANSYTQGGKIGGVRLSFSVS